MERQKIVLRACRLLLMLLLMPVALQAADVPWQGEVVGISNDDTIKFMHNGTVERIRLYGIDTPEKRQAFGKKAKQFTSSQVIRNSVKVVPMDTDRYDRTVAMVWLLVRSESLGTEGSFNEAIVFVPGMLGFIGNIVWLNSVRGGWRWNGMPKGVGPGCGGMWTRCHLGSLGRAGDDTQLKSIG
jgi:hypothetical protein